MSSQHIQSSLKTSAPLFIIVVFYFFLFSPHLQTRFDHLKGNVIEFQYPMDVSLSGIEYKTLPAGSHTIKADIMYSLSSFI